MIDLNKINGSKENFIDKLPKWILILLLIEISLGFICFLIATSPLKFHDNQMILISETYLPPDSKCSSAANCIKNAYCFNTTENLDLGVCVCSKEFYFDANLSKIECLPRKEWNLTCKNSDECLSTKGLKCLSGICNCSHDDFFYNPSENHCQPLKPIYDICESKIKIIQEICLKY